MSIPKAARIVGLITAFSYLTVLLSAWIYQDIIKGDMFVTFYEMNKIIRYAEWVIGVFSVLVLIHMIIEEINPER